MKGVLQKIGRDIWAYMVCILVVFFIWDWAFGYLTRIKTEEKVSVFIGSYSVSYDKADYLNETRPEYLKVVQVNAYSLDVGMFPTYLNVFGYVESDILILPEFCISEEICTNYYAEIFEEYQNVFKDLGCNLGFYGESNVYGIKIHDKESGESLIKGIDYGEGENEEDYYLLFNKRSLHLSDLSGGKPSEMNGAIEVAKRLLSYEET